MSSNKIMSWNDRFALIDHYQPSDDAVCTAFGVEQGELDTARSLRDAGTFVANSQLDVSKYQGVFASGNAIKTTKTVKAASGATTHTKVDKPETATKTVKVKVPAKRGRKGDKITKALVCEQLPGCC